MSQSNRSKSVGFYLAFLSLSLHAFTHALETTTISISPEELHDASNSPQSIQNDVDKSLFHLNWLDDYLSRSVKTAVSRKNRPSTCDRWQPGWIQPLAQYR